MRKLASGPSTSEPVRVIAIWASSSLPEALAVFATGASFTGLTLIVALAGVASGRPPASVAVNRKVLTPFQFPAGTKYSVSALPAAA